MSDKTMNVTYDKGRIWHTDCPENKFNSGIMKEIEVKQEEKRSLILCLHCGQSGWLPFGANGCGTIERKQ